MATVADALTALVRQAAEAAGHGEAPVPLEPAVPTSDPKHGDYQSNFAFRLGKALRTNPREVAQRIADALPDDPMVASVEVAGPGFLNFRLDDAWLGAEVARRVADPRLDGPTPGAGKTLVLDYSSPNLAKRMHVGHMRSTIIGNALDRLYRYLGWDVVADNHVGDWGTPFGKLIVMWRRDKDDAAYAADPIGELQRLYQAFGPASDEDPTLIEVARAETVKLQSGDPDNRALWEDFVRVSLEEFDRVYERLGVKHDVVLGESAYHDALAPLVDELLAAGTAVESDGAVIVPFTNEDGKGLAKQPLMIRKSDGGFGYGTTDLATVRYRQARWDPACCVYVTDTRQQLHFRQVFAAARKLGFEGRLEHVWFGMLRFADGSVAATRGGSQLVNLIDLLDEAHRRAREVVDAKNPDLPDDEKEAIAEAVGVAAIRYADLSQNPQSDVVFAWDKMLALNGNTAPYLMYAHARCHAILRKGGAGDAPAVVVPEDPTERLLCVQILQLPEVIAAAAETARPNLLADHLYGLCQTFARFYVACPVLKDDVPAEVRASRLGLVVATARALKLGFSLLGIEALERM